MVHQDFCNVTLDQKLRDRWIKLELPDLSLLNSHIWRRYFPSQQFQIDFSVFAAQARSLMMDVSAYHGRGKESDHLFEFDTQNCPTHAQLNLS